MDPLLLVVVVLLIAFALWGGLSVTPLLFLVLFVVVLVLLFGTRRW